MWRIRFIDTGDYFYAEFPTRKAAFQYYQKNRNHEAFCDESKNWVYENCDDKTGWPTLLHHKKYREIEIVSCCKRHMLPETSIVDYRKITF